MKTLITTIALVAVSATASMAGDFNLTSWGDRNGKLWSFTKDNGSVWNFYGTGYVNDLKAEISAKNTTISQLQALAIDNADTISALRAQVSDLEAQLAVAMAAPTIGDLTPESEEVSALMSEVSNSGILDYVSMDNVEELIRTGVLVSGSSSTTIADIEAFGIDTEALQELRDIRVAAVEAGKAHSSYNGTVDAHSVNRTDSVVYDSFGNDDGLSTMFTINGRTVDLTETGADMVFTNGAAEITDWIDGFENGYNAGYEDGYADGFADGYAAGVSDSTN